MTLSTDLTRSYEKSLLETEPHAHKFLKSLVSNDDELRLLDWRRLNTFGVSIPLRPFEAFEASPALT